MRLIACAQCAEFGLTWSVVASRASRSVAFKAARVRESIMEDQDELLTLTRKSECEEVGLENK